MPHPREVGEDFPPTPDFVHFWIHRSLQNNQIGPKHEEYEMHENNPRNNQQNSLNNQQQSELSKEKN